MDATRWVCDAELGVVDEDDGADGPAASLNPVGTVAEAAVEEGAAAAAAVVAAASAADAAAGVAGSVSAVAGAGSTTPLSRSRRRRRRARRFKVAGLPVGAAVMTKDTSSQWSAALSTAAGLCPPTFMV